VPIVTLLWAASSALRSTRPIAVVAGGILVLAAVATLGMFTAPRYVDLDWRDGVACAEQHGSCVVPINPVGFEVRLVRR
jgi:hypothetical protein